MNCQYLTNNWLKHARPITFYSKIMEQYKTRMEVTFKLAQMEWQTNQNTRWPTNWIKKSQNGGYKLTII